VVASALLAQIGDIARFAAPGHLCSYAGLVPRVQMSGTIHRRGRITRAGRSTLRWAVSIAAMNAIRLPGPLRDFKQRLQERRPRGVAMTAAARKFLVIVWRILTYREPYRETAPDTINRKLRRSLNWGKRRKRRDTDLTEE
jgi:transposase